MEKHLFVLSAMALMALASCGGIPISGSSSAQPSSATTSSQAQSSPARPGVLLYSNR